MADTAPTATPFIHSPLFSFPPFFTLQTNPATRATQLTHWSNLVLKWAAATRTFHLDASSDEPTELWFNPRISRRLDAKARAALLAHMVAESNAAWEATPQANVRSGAGSASAATTAPTKALIFWRKPQEWGDLIYKWISDTGQSRGILTFFELTEGDLVQGQEFANLPAGMLRLALDTLVARGKAQVFAGTGVAGSRGLEGMEGVKFA